MEKATRKSSVMRIVSLALALLLTAGLLGSGPAVATAETSDPIRGTSVSLGSELVLNFYVAVTDTQGAAMTFRINQEERVVPVTQARPVEDNLYVFSCTLAPAMMTQPVQATYTDSGSSYETTASVRDYAQKLFASKQWDKLAANDMMLATLNYGAATQQYFGYRLADLANDGYVVAPTATVPEAESATMASGSASGITFYGASLVFESRIAVRFYFDVTGDISQYTFSAGEAPVAKNGLYYVEVPDINPQDYATPITLTVNDTLTVTYSPMQYITRMYAKTGSAELKTLLTQLYQYHLTALDYLQDPYGNDMDNLVVAQ